ncbi:peptide deformylase [Thaumasiovibrio subtropicus]|uniref:peptide deformylase n=1 Tax=Thaumasiovibrio subtropicus TaxID=1891207 RepID=UPI000B355281|nr:peptide deformylase [Thaumasiovibrio subtropicus]
MAILNILTIPDPKLREKARPVEDVAAVQPLIDDMLETMYSTDNGIGLASTQVGRREAVIVIDLSDERNDPLVLINPELVEGEIPTIGQEGCLSIPDYYADVERFKKVKVRYLDREGKEQVIENEAFLAIAIQHEMDHLIGKLFIDYLSPLKRQIALKKVKKYEKKRRA